MVKGHLISILVYQLYVIISQFFDQKTAIFLYSLSKETPQYRQEIKALPSQRINKENLKKPSLFPIAKQVIWGASGATVEGGGGGLGAVLHLPSRISQKELVLVEVQSRWVNEEL